LYRYAAAAGDAAVNALALQQWGDCSILGGKSLLAIGLPASTLASFPAAPEFGTYAAAAAVGLLTQFECGS
jgi:hypothetical protein